METRRHRFVGPDGQVLQIVGANGNDQVFTVEKLGTFNVDAAKAWIDETGLSPNSIVMDSDAVLARCKEVDLDQVRLREIAADTALITKPVIIINWGDGTHVSIDGHHRLYLWANMGVEAYPAWIIPSEFKRRFIVRYFLDGRLVSNEEILARTFGIYATPEGIRR